MRDHQGKKWPQEIRLKVLEFIDMHQGENNVMKLIKEQYGPCSKTVKNWLNQRAENGRTYPLTNTHKMIKYN